MKRLVSTLTNVAEAIARAEPSMPDEKLTTAARRVVQLLAFLRVCVARGRLTDEELVGAASAGPLDAAILPLAEKLGPGLFGLAPPTVQFDADRLRHVLAQLDVCQDSVDMLGRIHETLLAKRLTRTARGRTRVENVSRRKKSRGVFYTPPYIARYMVGRVLPGPRRLLDPACGCGVFLLEAGRRLRSQRQAPETVAESLFGTDLDPEAVLIARQSLWLELTTRHDAADARALADALARNIRQGDVLADGVVPPGSMDVVLGNPPYRRELNTKRLLDRIAQTELGRRFRTARMDLWYYFVHRGLELLRPGGRLSFIVSSYWTRGVGAEKLIAALRESTHVEEIFLLDKLGVFPTVGGRHLILTVKNRRRGQANLTTTIKRPAVDGRAARSESAEPYVCGHSPLIVFHKTADQLFRDGRIDLERPDEDLLAKFSPWPRLDTLGSVRQGIAENPATVTEQTNRAHGVRWRIGEGVFTLTPEELARLAIPLPERGLIRPYHDLRDLGRYFLADEPSLALIYSTAGAWPELDQFPVLAEHLARFRPIMEARRETRRGVRPWWQLHWPRDESLWRRTKVIALQMAERPSFVAAERPVYVPFSANVFVPHESTRESVHYFAALLNSRLLWRWYRLHAKRRGIGLELNGHVLSATPIRPIDFSQAADVVRHDRLVELAQRMTSLRGRLRGGPENEKAGLQEQFAQTDRQIDEVVDSLYAVDEKTSKPEA